MSKDAAASFLRKVFEDHALQDRVRQALAEPDRQASLKQVAEQEGLAFTDAEFRAVRDDLLERLGSGGELSEASLEAVSGGNTMDAFRESIQETNENTKYWLMKLDMNASMGEKLSDYLNDLATASSTMSRKEPP